MRTKKVTRHYCDHCSKGMFQKPAMAQHEGVCFKNPNRRCWLCEDAVAREDLPSIVKQLKERDNDPDDREIASENLQWLRGICGNCPACILAALQQANLYAHGRFDYKKERDNWRAERDRQNMEGIAL